MRSMSIMRSMMSSLSSAKAEEFGPDAPGGGSDDPGWPEAEELEARRGAVLRALAGEVDGHGGGLPPGVADKCLRQHGGDVPRATAVGRGLLRFRRSVGWRGALRLREDVHAGALRSGMHWLLRDRLGRAVLVYRFQALDIAVAAVAAFQQMAMYLIEQATEDVRVQQVGVALLFDCRAVDGGALAAAVGLDDVQRGKDMWAGNFPCRLKRVLVVGLSAPTAALVSTLLWSGLPAKLFARVAFLGSMDGAVAELGSAQLPPELGGSLRGPTAAAGEVAAAEKPRGPRSSRSVGTDPAAAGLADDRRHTAGQADDRQQAADGQVAWSWGAVVDAHFAGAPLLPPFPLGAVTVA